MAQIWEDRRQAGAVAAWASARECEYDSRLLTERIHAQILAAGSASGKDAPTLLDTVPRTLQGLAGWLRESTARSSSGILLCLDDIGFHPDLADEIEDFMLAAPADVEIVAATTAGIGFARIAARRQLREVRADALAFTFDEAKAVARGEPGTLIPEPDVHTLWKRTQGWGEPLCILLQAASTDEATVGRLVVERVTGRDSDLDRYFRSAILASLPSEVREFCIRASILGPISADYFNHVFGRSDGAYVIEKLSAERMLLTPLDRAQSGYEFHPLLREFLEHRFAVEHHGPRPELFARAAQWQRESGHSRESISLYLRAGDRDAAAEVASTSMMDIALRQGEVDQIQLWRRSFSEAVSAPTIILGLVWAQIFSHDQKHAAALLSELRAVSVGLSDEAARRQMEWWCDLIAAIGEATADNLEESRRQCELWLKLHDEADLVCRGAILTCLCFIAASERRPDDLAKLSAEASSVNTVANHRYALGWLHSTMIFSEISRGNMQAGTDLLRRARNDDNAQINATPFSANLLDMLELELRYEANQLDGIAARVDDVLDFVRQHGVVDFVFSAFRTAAAIAHRDGDRKGAIELFQEVRVIARECAFPRLDALARLALADLLVLDDAGEANAVLPAQSEPVFQTTHGPYLRALKSLTEARIASRQAKYHLCGRLANAALDHARRSQSSRLEISALLCLAGANAATERSAAAEQRVADAVDIAARSGCYRTLLDERQYLEVLGPVSLPLLDLMPDEREFGGRGIAPGDRPSYAPIATDTVLLTRKELAILHRIKEGLSNRDIAARHRISEDTVKWHVHNIFSKLEVRSRVQAILRAEDMRILE
ncbi:helix-turn-helix transcriptional regulator [Sphingomonas trueperi]|uniref:LuxR family maltose regulon positive regulatory protein n=2 Tax=Sphingomonas TaxID=13687 RepID=A0A7X5XXG6_9SPHN|nr:LuxR C-terminal-related transcriptional regulator [Sphingomonas trueperi]NJB97163.1 LuxR family maltose regulon positive regulatory protein [Sphingomonas trueperi]